MHHSSELRKGLLAAGLVGSSGITWLTVEFLSATNEQFNGYLLTWLFLCAILLNIASLLARWLLTKSRQRTLLAGRLPFAIAFSKVVAFGAVVMLLLSMLAGLVLGEPFRDVTLRALVFGAVWTGVWMLGANGLMNMIVVVRHRRGTLPTTSREVAGWF